jgi:hypothetical protein
MDCRRSLLVRSLCPSPTIPVFKQLTQASFCNKLVFIYARNPALGKTLRDNAESLQVLVKGCTSFTIVDEESNIPIGCVSENISPELGVHLLIKVRLLIPRENAVLTSSLQCSGNRKC